MTAILNFTLPRLDGLSGKTSAPDASLSATRAEGAGNNRPGNRVESTGEHQKGFGQLLNERIVKKETEKEGDFDAIAQSGGDARDDAENPISGNLSNKLPRSSDSGPAILNIEPGITQMAGLLKGDKAEAITPLKVSGDENSGKLAPDLPVSVESLVRPAQKTTPEIRPDLQSRSVSSQDTGTLAQDLTTTRSDELPVSVKLRNEKAPEPSPAAKGIFLAGDAEELPAEQTRQSQTVAADELSRPSRIPATQQPGISARSNPVESETAGKQLPSSGKLLPPEPLQSPTPVNQASSPRTKGASLVTEYERQTAKTRSTNGRENIESTGIEKINVVSSRIIAPELFGKAVGQVPPVTGTETNSGFQGASSDSPATGLLAQHQAGLERTANARMNGPLTGFDGGNTPTLQAGGQDMSAQLGSRIRWMNSTSVSSAELKLSPAELGTLEIRITAEDDQTRVNFVTSTSAAKELIEASMPRLRELLGQSGLLLEQGDVTHRDLSQNKSKAEVPTIERSAFESLESESLESTIPMYQRSASDHRVDHFA